MRTEIAYTIPAGLPGDISTTVYVDWEISFSMEDRGICVHGIAREIQIEVGGEAFPGIQASGIYAPDFKAWLAAREADLNPAVIGWTEDACILQYAEDEAYKKELASKIGVPL